MSQTNIYNKILCRVLDKHNNRQKNVNLRPVMSCERFQPSSRSQTQFKHFKSIADFTKFLLPVNNENTAHCVTTPMNSSKARPKRSLIPVPVTKSRTKSVPKKTISVPNLKVNCNMQVLAMAMSNKIMENLLFPRPPFVRSHSHIAARSVLLADQID